MPGIGIMTDSNCGIMPSEETSYGIHMYSPCLSS